MERNVNEVLTNTSGFFFFNLGFCIFNIVFLLQTLLDDISENKSHKEIITDIKEFSVKTDIPDHETVGLIWGTVIGLAEWNKKEELVTDQALKHLKQYTQLFKAFATTDRAELALILKVQEFCYENMNFMKAFQKIILLFYKCKSFLKLDINDL